MASFALANTPFPDGTEVGAYDATGYTTLPANGPLGTPVTTATAEGRGVSFTGLENATAYFAAAKVSGKWLWRRFVTSAASEPEAWESALGEERSDREAAVKTVSAEIFAIGMSKARLTPSEDPDKDTERLQEAFGNESPNEVLLGGGDTFYAIRETVEYASKKKISGSGRGVTHLVLDAGVNGDVLRSQNFEEGGVLDVTIDGLSIDGNGANNASGHGLSGEGQRIHVSNVLLLNCAEDGRHQIAFTEERDKSGGGIDNRDFMVHAVACGRHGIYRDDHDYSLVQCQGIQNADRNGYMASNGLLEGCHFWNYASNASASDIGLDLDTNVRCVNVTVEGASVAHVILRNANNALISCDLFNSTGFPNVPLLVFEAGATSTFIEACDLHDFGEGGAMVFNGNALNSHINAHFFDPAGKSAGKAGEGGTLPHDSIMWDVTFGGSTTRGVIPGYAVRRRLSLSPIAASTNSIPNRTFICDSDDSERLKFKDKDGTTSYVARGSRGALATAADNTAIDAAYGEAEQKVVENLRTRQAELVAKLVEARILV